MVMYMKKKKNKNNRVYNLLGWILAIVSLIFLGILFYIDLLPTRYLVLITAIVFVFDLLNILLIRMKNLKKKIRKVLSIFIILAILFMSLASFYIGKTLGILLFNGDSKYKLENYSVIVLKDSSYKDIKDIKNKKVGYFENSIGAEEANKKLSKKVKVKYEGYTSSDNIVDDLLNKNVDAIVLEDSIKNIIEEESSEFSNSIRVIYTFKVKIKVESTLKDVDVAKKPFAIYLSGIDTYGEISSVSRSDVNIVVVANPKTYQILLISIPRDYYVQLHGTTGYKDKLTHAGIYGIDMSIQTLEDLLEMDINYYVKVNFTSVIDIVDALEGLEVYSEYTFISYSDFSFKEGMNSVNGEQALDFARTRKAFVDGDRQRGKNQQAVIEALVRKLSSKKVITKYNSLLNAVNGKYQTNMSTKKITSLVKLQLDKMPKWTVTSYSLSGYDSSNYTYTYNQLLYVMEPDEDTVEEAKSLIQKVLNGETLEDSYTDIGGKSNKVKKVETTENTYVAPTPAPRVQEKTEQEDTTDEEQAINNEDNNESNREENIDAEDTNQDSENSDPLDTLLPDEES